MVLGRWLVIPDIARISIDMAALESFRNGLRIANCTTGGIDNPNALLRATERVLVEEITGTFMQGAVHSNNVALHEIVRALEQARGEAGRTQERKSLRSSTCRTPTFCSSSVGQY